MDSELQAERKHLSHFDSKVKDLEKNRKMKKEMAHEAELQWNRLSLELGQFEKDKAETEARAKDLLTRNPWIKDQRQ